MLEGGKNQTARIVAGHRGKVKTGWYEKYNKQWRPGQVELDSSIRHCLTTVNASDTDKLVRHVRKILRTSAVYPMGEE